jgi:hypothetical protein
MISALKNDSVSLTHNILRLEVTKNLRIWHKKFSESQIKVKVKFCCECDNMLFVMNIKHITIYNFAKF